jgi:UTP--glucose-1-phosphate uridylyltransferase
MKPDRNDPRVHPFIELMRLSGASGAAIDTFLLHLKRLLDGETGVMPRHHISPIESLPDADSFESYRGAGRRALAGTVVIKLNGGLGTSMGLEKAKSLLKVRGDRTFLDLIAQQVLALRRRIGVDVPLLLMNSFRTERDSLRLLANYPDLAVHGLPLSFLQNRVPRVREDRLTPAHDPFDPDRGWCPPGHGDLYSSLLSSGILGSLLDHGYEFAFVSNADNLGASLDTGLLGYMEQTGATFVVEAAERTSADRKGGHLCLLRNGRLALRESAQVSPEELEEFQDTTVFRYFNTNNIWLHLPTLAALLRSHNGVLPLATIVNRKTLDPRDPESPPVVQLETALGAAVSLFSDAAAVRVSRRRFSPVKTTNDLLGVRSDAYQLTPEGHVVLDSSRRQPPTIRLDRRFFKLVESFEERFPHGPPSLVACDSLEVLGDVRFADGVIVRGAAVVEGGDEARIIPCGTVIEGVFRPQ